MALRSFSFTVLPDHDGMTARNFLRRVCGLTARSMTVIKYAGTGITRGGALLRSCDTVYAGDIIDIRLPDEACGIEPVGGELGVLYEDDRLLVVNKPPHMPVHPTKVHQTDTLANIVSAYQQEKGESWAFRALNRLDKDTSGCVMISKDRLSYVLTQPSVSKTYYAVCEGILEEGGTIDAPIALENGSKIRRCVAEGGKHAVTRYEPIRSGSGHTLLRLTLLTGRTHQIRCHMSSVGHPLAGDDLYGGSRALIDRQALHCGDISFIHPISKEPVELHTPVPKEFYAVLGEQALI